MEGGREGEKDDGFMEDTWQMNGRMDKKMEAGWMEGEIMDG